MGEKEQRVKEIQDAAENERQLHYRESIARRILQGLLKPSSKEKDHDKEVEENEAERRQSHTSN